MESNQVIRALAALAQESRLAIFRLLVQSGPSGLTVGKIAEHLNIAPATLSFHLKELTFASLLRSRQEGRFVFYMANFAVMNDLLGFLTANCCGGIPCAPAATCMGISLEGGEPMDDKVFNVMFLCTHNSARSLMAEAIINNPSVNRGRFHGYSAGSNPPGKPNPFAVKQIRDVGLPVDGVRSKAWDEFVKPDAPRMDFVFTVCDNAANEVCPVWPGQPVTAHWGLPDPAAAKGSNAQKRQAFAEAYRNLSNRILLFASLPMDKLDKLSLRKKLEEIGLQ